MATAQKEEPASTIILDFDQKTCGVKADLSACAQSPSPACLLSWPHPEKLTCWLEEGHEGPHKQWAWVERVEGKRVEMVGWGKPEVESSSNLGACQRFWSVERLESYHESLVREALVNMGERVLQEHPVGVLGGCRSRYACQCARGVGYHLPAGVNWAEHDWWASYEGECECRLCEIYEVALEDNECSWWTPPRPKYYLDFFLPEPAVAIEVDGQFHLKQVKKDTIRQRWCEKWVGASFVRVSTRDVLSLYAAGALEKWLEEAIGDAAA